MNPRVIPVGNYNNALRPRFSQNNYTQQVSIVSRKFTTIESMVLEFRGNDPPHY